METELKPVTELSYNEALTQLGQIVNAMQADNCDIDKLAGYTRRATELIAECRRRLTATDEELSQILQSLQQ
ncbi:MAG: exodeoxyribonuclease VII small subunit [Clostridiales bacterium]|nr:exodeoxyribonuclease VII small subunit [Clostridiales bacterium]